MGSVGGGGGGSSFANTHRLRHTPNAAAAAAADFQPPYFPPPYSLPPQQAMDFGHHHHHHHHPAASDPYSHLNHYNTSHVQPYPNTDRHHLLSAADSLASSLHRGAGGAGGFGAAAPYDARRSSSDYIPTVTRPNVLIPTRGGHELHDTSSLFGLPPGNTTIGLEDAHQVSVIHIVL